IGTWSAEAGDEAVNDGVAPGHKHDRHRRGHRLGNERRRRVSDDQDDLPTNQISDQERQSVSSIFRRTIFDLDVLACDEACCPPPRAERGRQMRGISERGTADESDHRYRRLLRARRERPRSRAAECSQQFPPSDGDCHTPLPCEVRRKDNDTTPPACSLHDRARTPRQSQGRCAPSHLLSEPARAISTCAARTGSVRWSDSSSVTSALRTNSCTSVPTML